MADITASAKKLVKFHGLPLECLLLQSPTAIRKKLSCNTYTFLSVYSTKRIYFLVITVKIKKIVTHEVSHESNFLFTMNIRNIYSQS